MKKKESFFIAPLLGLLSAVPSLGRKLYVLSSLYSDIYRGYSYDPRKNGERELIQAMSISFKSARPILFDVGANKGEWTKMAKQALPAAEIHCFEISPETFKTLTRNLERFADVHLNCFGLSDQAGKGTFIDYGADHGGNTLIQNPCFTHGGTQTRTRTSLSTGEIYLTERNIRHIDLLKVDVEGWDLFVLKGFGSYLDPEKISAIQFEYGYTHGDVHILMKDFYEVLQGKGYVIGRLKKSGIDFIPFQYFLNDFKSGPNFVACHPGYCHRLLRF